MSQSIDPAIERAVNAELALAQNAMAAGRLAEARQRAEAVAARVPASVPARLIASQAAIIAGDIAVAMRHIDAGLLHAPQSGDLHLHRARCLIAQGNFVEARVALAAAEDGAASLADQAARAATLWGMIGDAYGLCREYPRAHDAYDAAIGLDPATARHFFNRAAVSRYLGNDAQAAADYQTAIGMEPDHAEAYFNLVQLTRQTPADNRVDALEQLAQRLPEAAGTLPQRIQARFALAKSYEDLGDGPKSFAHLAVGARLMRGAIRYDLNDDLAMMAALRAADWRLPVRAAPDGPTPIFVLGLPRSGTTVVERILSSHSQVGAIGESPAFPQALAMVSQRSGPVSRDRDGIARALARIDPAAVGAAYLAETAALVAGDQRWFVDKLPANHLYLAMIACALPAAPIVLVSRHPLANLYGLYKTLFNQANPWSYDLDDLVGYYAGYRALMAHYRGVLGDRLIEVSHQELVEEPDRVIRDLLARCGLDLDPACLSFHDNPLPCTTHSASQVRQPLNRDGMDSWRRFSAELEPLRQRLLAAGVPPEELA